MGIILKKLTPSPSNIDNNATTTVIMKYNAKTDDINENDVHMTLSIDESDNIFLKDDNGNNVSSISWDQPLPSTLGPLSKTVSIVSQVSNPNTFSLRLDGTGKLGSTAGSGSSITVN